MVVEITLLEQKDEKIVKEQSDDMLYQQGNKRHYHHLLE